METSLRFVIFSYFSSFPPGSNLFVFVIVFVFSQQFQIVPRTLSFKTQIYGFIREKLKLLLILFKRIASFVVFAQCYRMLESEN